MYKYRTCRIIISILILTFLVFSCKTPDDNNSDNQNIDNQDEDDVVEDIVFYRVEMNVNYVAFSTTHTVTEFHCVDLGDSYYEVTTYKVHYFSAGTSGSSSYNANGAYRNKTAGELVDIVKQGNVTPNFIEKRITTNTSNRTITDYETNKSIVLYIPEKVKHEGWYYGITKK